MLRNIVARGVGEDYLRVEPMVQVKEKISVSLDSSAFMYEKSYLISVLTSTSADINIGSPTSVLTFTPTLVPIVCVIVVVTDFEVCFSSLGDRLQV